MNHFDISIDTFSLNFKIPTVTQFVWVSLCGNSSTSHDMFINSNDLVLSFLKRIQLLFGEVILGVRGRNTWAVVVVER